MTNADIVQHLSFAEGYSVALLRELPGREVPNLFFIPPRGTGGRDGVLVEISHPDGEQWIACCAFGQFGIGVSAVIASPQPEKIFVLATGQGYVIDAKNPAYWNEIPSTPTLDVRVVQDLRLVLFSDFTTICAYGIAGFIWKSKRLCWDELKISKIERSRIFGTGYDPTNSKKSYGEFELDLFTGEVRKSDFEYLSRNNVNSWR